MLIARGAKRDAKTRFAADARVDLIDGGQTIGRVVYAIGPETATIAIGGETYRMARERPRKEEALHQAAIRLVRGGEWPSPNPILLTDAAGRRLAQALDTGKEIVIRMDDDRFAFRRRSLFSRRFDLYRDGSVTPLGSTGQKSFLSTLMTSDLPSEIPPVLQAFLIALLFDRTFVALDRSNNQGG